MRILIVVFILFGCSNVIAHEVFEKKGTVIAFVLDESGSMEDCKDATISGFNEYVNSLKKKDGEVGFRLTRFNSETLKFPVEVYSVKCVNLLDQDCYNPDGNTPLYDAIGHVINNLQTQSCHSNILVVIMTDGEENASREYDKDEISKLIKESEDKGWTFVYLGANQDAWDVGMQLGFNSGNILQFNTADIVETFNTLSNSTNIFIDTGSVQTNAFFEDSLIIEEEK